MNVILQRASVADLPALVDWVTRYHKFEGISGSEAQREAALLPLLRDDSLGLVWLIKLGDEIAGYIAVCFGYSIEFGGRDCFVDEFFISETYRGHGLGRETLNLVMSELSSRGVVALSLEVARTNHAAQAFYAHCGFAPRADYSLITRPLS